MDLFANVIDGGARKKKRSVSPWLRHVRKYMKKHNVDFSTALSKAKRSYRKKGSKSKESLKVRRDSRPRKGKIKARREKRKKKNEKNRRNKRKSESVKKAVVLKDCKKRRRVTKRGVDDSILD